MLLTTIIAREMRVQARRRGTTWCRFWVVLGAMGLGGIMGLFSDEFGTPHELAKTLFIAFGVLAMAVSLLAGTFLTADCLSTEKREGTLGLLFLTDLKGYDVVLGKLTATSLVTVYALLGIFPVMAIPLLMGGVAAGEFWRMILVLLVTIFFSLAIGMGISAMSRQTRNAAVATLGVIFFLCVFLPLVWCVLALVFKPKTAFNFLLWPSPCCAFTLALDENYRGPGQMAFWLSLSLVILLGLSFFVCACLVLPRVWHEKQESPRREAKESFWAKWRYESTRGREVRRNHLQEDPLYWLANRGRLNPFYWLGSRDRTMFWLAMGLLLLLYLPWVAFVVYMLLNIGHRRPYEALPITLGVTYLMHQVIKGLYALEASRRLNDDLQSGALELLAVTPIKAEHAVQGLRKAVLELFRIPTWVAILANLCLIWLAGYMQWPGNAVKTLYAVLAGGIVLLLADCHALTWVGMRMALRTRRHTRAVLATLVRIMLVPWLAIFLLAVIVTNSGMSEKSFYYWLVMWCLGSLALDFVATRKAKKDLLHNFRGLIAEGAQGQESKWRLLGRWLLGLIQRATFKPALHE